MSRANGYTPSYRGDRTPYRGNSRPPSEQLVDLHVYIVPTEIWRDRYNNLLNQSVTETISAGIIRVHPEQQVSVLRDEIDQQIGAELIPREYVFLKSVGRSITKLKPKQEFQLKVKHFVPPQAYAPELYILEGSPDAFGGSSQGSTRPHSRTPELYNSISNSLNANQQSNRTSKNLEVYPEHGYPSPAYRNTPIPIIRTRAASQETLKDVKPEPSSSQEDQTINRHSRSPSPTKGKTQSNESSPSKQRRLSHDSVPSKHGGTPSSRHDDVPHKATPTEAKTIEPKEEGPGSEAHSGRSSSLFKANSNSQSSKHDPSRPQSPTQEKPPSQSSSRASKPPTPGSQGSNKTGPQSKRGSIAPKDTPPLSKRGSIAPKDTPPMSKRGSIAPKESGSQSKRGSVGPQEISSPSKKGSVGPQENSSPSKRGSIGSRETASPIKQQSEGSKENSSPLKHGPQSKRGSIASKPASKRGSIAPQDIHSNPKSPPEIVKSDDVEHAPSIHSQGEGHDNKGKNTPVTSANRSRHKDQKYDSLGERYTTNTNEDSGIAGLTPEEAYRENYDDTNYRRKQEDEKRRQQEEEERRRREEEDRKRQEDDDRRHREDDDRRKKIEDERQRHQDDVDRKRREEDERKRQEDELKKRLEDEEEKERKRQEKEEMERLEFERKRQEEEKRRREEEERRKREEEERKKLEEERNKRLHQKPDDEEPQQRSLQSSRIQINQSDWSDEDKGSTTKNININININDQSEFEDDTKYLSPKSPYRMGRTSRRKMKKRDVSWEDQSTDAPSSDNENSSRYNASHRAKNNLLMYNRNKSSDIESSFSDRDNLNPRMKLPEIQKNKETGDGRDENVIKVEKPAETFRNDTYNKKSDLVGNGHVQNGDGDHIENEQTTDRPSMNNSSREVGPDSRHRQKSNDLHRNDDNHEEISSHKQMTDILSVNGENRKTSTEHWNRESENNGFKAESYNDVGQNNGKLSEENDSAKDTMNETPRNGHVSDKTNETPKNNSVNLEVGSHGDTKEELILRLEELNGDQNTANSTMKSDGNRFASPPALKMTELTEAQRQRNFFEREKLFRELELAKEERKLVERQREELVRKAKQMQNKTQNRRNHARDLWKKRYFEEKKKTNPLEEQCNRLRHELDIIHRKLMNTLEGPKEKQTRVGELKPSKQSNYKIQVTRMQHETEELRTRLENSKMKLTAELKLRTQAETELRALRAELMQKKIHLSLQRSQPVNSMASPGPGQNELLTYRQPLITPRS